MQRSHRLARIALRACALCVVLLGTATDVAFAQGTYFLSGPEGVNQPHVFPTAAGDVTTAGIEGGNPYSGLVLGRDGNLYGTTYGGGTNGGSPSDYGTIFMVNGTTGEFHSLYSFTAGADGEWPVAGLIQGQPGDDALYGVTYFGGTGGFGTIFRCRITGAPGSETCITDALYSFHGDIDGGNPIANLIQASDGSFWGVAAYEGASQGGTIFKCTVTASNTCLEVDGNGLLPALYSFAGSSDGAAPQGALLQGLDGSFYGTTWAGGVSDNGTLFKFNPVTSTFTSLYEFSGGADGGQLFGNLVQTSDGSLWGTTFSGALNRTPDFGGDATIFRCTLTGTAGNETCTLDTYEFSGGPDGRNPNAGLFASSDGSLYAPTWFGSGSNAGTIVKCTPVSTAGLGPCAVDSTGLLPTVYTFGIIDGDGPNGLVQTSDGSFWGTTSYGGSGFGTIFRLAPLPSVSLSGPTAVVVNATSPAGTLVTLSGTVSDAANPNITNPATTVTWTIDGNLVHTDSFSVGPLTAVPISLAVTYPAGTHTVTISAKDTAATADTAVTTYSVTVEVDKLNQTVTFAQPANQTFNIPAPTITLAPTASSTLPVSLSVSGPATLAGNVLTITGVGTVTVTASQAGDGQYNPAPDQVQSFTVAKGSQTITFPNPGPLAFSTTPITLGATASSGLPVSYSGLTGPATLANGVLTITGVGNISVTANQSGNGNFNAATAAKITIVVNKANQTITFPNPGPLTFGTSPVSLGATASSGLAVTYSGVTGPATLSNGVLTITGAGNISVTANQTGNANFSGATAVTITIAVNKANQTITFNAVPPQTPGTTVGLVAASTSGLTVSLTFVSGPGSLSGTTLTSSAVGTIVLRASQAGNANYNAATDVVQNITVGKANQTIAFTAVPAQMFGGPAVTLVATATSGLPATFAVTSGPGTIPLNSNVLTTTGVGTIVVTASQAGNTQYNAAPDVVQNVAVGKGNQTITFSPTAAPAVGGPAVTLAATATSGLPVTFALVSGPGTLSGNQLTATGFGTIVVTASQAGNANYNAAPDVTQNIAVAKTNQTITFPAVSSPTFGTASVPLAATASSALPVTYTVVSGPGAVSGSTLTITGAGTIVVKASQAGNSAYNAAPDVSQSIAVNKAPLTITAVAAGRNYGLANPAFTASYAGFVNGNGPTSLTGTLTFTTTATTTSLPGTYPVTPGGVTSANYAITFVAGTLTVLDIAPVAANDAATTSTGTAVTISVLTNDAHAFGTLTITAVTTPAHGTAAISGQSIVYTPAAGYVGADSFTYTENDGFGGTSTGTVTLTVGTPVSALGKFVAFSNDLTWLHTGATVTTGDVGANLSRRHGHGHGDDDDDHDHWSGNGHGDDDDDDSVTVRFDANAIMQQTTSRAVGDTVELAAHSSIYGLVKNSLVNHGGTILGTTVNTMAVPYLTLPVFPSISAGTTSVNVTRNTTKTLAAGKYGAIHVESGGKLILTGGLYQIVSLDVDQSATVLFKAAVDLRIKTSLNADTSSQIITDPTVSGLRAAQIKIYVASADDDGGCHNRYQDPSDDDFGGEVAVNIGENAIVKANIYAPNGTVWLKTKAQGTGAFIGEHVEIGPSATLTLDSAF